MAARVRLLVYLAFPFLLPRATAQPGPGPFGSVRLPQPVPGADDFGGFGTGRLCDVTAAPYGAKNGSNATAALRAAIDDCGDLPAPGGTVLVPGGFLLYTASLWLRSNLTLRVETGAVLRSTATGDGKTSASTGDAPLVYTRRNDLMVWAHAGFLNAGRCIRFKDPLVGWDDCAEWTKLHNVVLEGGGTLDGDGDAWWDNSRMCNNARPMMLDLLWVDGLTIRDLIIRRPGYWTVHPTFSNNVRVTNNSIVTEGHNTDGCDPDSSWNVYIEGNTFSTGDDCIAIKAGRDWSGLMVNISTQNVLVERNVFRQGHGISIGSETSGWVRNVTVRDAVLHGTNLAVRIKSMRGRGGGVEDVVYENLRGDAKAGISLNLNYHTAPKTNATATPIMRRITVRNVSVRVDESAYECLGLSDSKIEDIVFKDVQITGKGAENQECSECAIKHDGDTKPKPKC